MKVFTAFPSETQKWARDNGWILPPAQYSPLCPPKSPSSKPMTEQPIVITRPGANASFLLDPLVPDEQELIVLEARADDSVQKLNWLLNGEKIGEGSAPNFRLKWKPTPGSYFLEASTGSLKTAIRFEIKK
jgi:membrane carboxypeptidase/penicillin-binding protein PbpC